MDDSQNSSSDPHHPRPNDDEPDFVKKPSQPTESYYYDDSTGYEIYDEETESEEQRDDSENSNG